MVKMKTNMGLITLQLYEDRAQKTCANFLNYVNNEFYNGLIFHRVIKNFMIQGGGFTSEMIQKPTEEPIKNEARNGLSNKIGTIAMARTSDPNSATSQFFINTNDNNFLNHTSATPDGWGYCVFGKVKEGMNIVRKIEDVATGTNGLHQNVPLEDVIIEIMEVA